jgi:hypothetical protein
MVDDLGPPYVPILDPPLLLNNKINEGCLHLFHADAGLFPHFEKILFTVLFISFLFLQPWIKFEMKLLGTI